MEACMLLGRDSHQKTAKHFLARSLYKAWQHTLELNTYLRVVNGKVGQHSAWQRFRVHVKEFVIGKQQLICLLFHLQSSTEWYIAGPDHP